MHTDEYEISLSRELDVCKKKVDVLMKKLSRRENNFNVSTEELITYADHGETPSGDKDFIAWMDDYYALRKWQSTLQQYEELFLQMKI